MPSNIINATGSDPAPALSDPRGTARLALPVAGPFGLRSCQP